MKVLLKSPSGAMFRRFENPIPACINCKHCFYEMGVYHCTFGADERFFNPITGEFDKYSSLRCRLCREDVSVNQCGPFGLRFIQK